MESGRAQWGAVRIAWAETSSVGPIADSDWHPLGTQQVRRHWALSGASARRFALGRSLVAQLLADFGGGAGVTLTTTCERCGADHGRPIVVGAPLVVSISYADQMVAVAAARLADASAVGVDIEREPGGGKHARLGSLARVFAPSPAPDMEGWTRLEATLKADGRGLRVPLAQIDVATGVGERADGGGHARCFRPVRIPGRREPVDAALIDGPAGFVLSAAMIPAKF